MQTSEAAYKRTANRCAELAIACPAPSVGTAPYSRSRWITCRSPTDSVGRRFRRIEEIQEATGFGA
jgi:hypothetical protein